MLKAVKVGKFQNVSFVHKIIAPKNESKIVHKIDPEKFCKLNSKTVDYSCNKITKA